jgi:phosphoribosyl-ATP pyrophosphohydrolase/phosphoribosyl-AMP cyclohydrolase
MLIPSIDLMGGKAVQLRRGREKLLERDDPVELAREWSLFGEIAVVDLDRALGKGDNTALVGRLCAEADCRVGGGIRDEAQARRLLAAGAKRLVVGTRAEPGFLSLLPPERWIVALDSEHGKVVTEGWEKATLDTPEAKGKALAPYCSEFLVTFVEREGALEGTDLAEAKRLAKALPRPLTVAGGITTLDEVAALTRMGIHAQVGMAIYTGAFAPAEAMATSIDWTKGPVPTIAQDEAGNVLMLAFSTEDSLRKALAERKGWYFSRSRNRLWQKGETSRHVQALKRVRLDCDADTILFTVAQTGPACHRNAATCFGPAGRQGLERLQAQILARRGSGSYTDELLKNPRLLRKKLEEEAGEVVSFKDPANLAWEVADWLYFATALMAREGVSWSQVFAQLESRRKP